MAQTVTAHNACGAVIEIDDADGDPVNVSGSSNKASLSLSKQFGKGVTFEGEWNFTLECKKDGSLEISAMWTDDATEARELLEDWWESGGNRVVSIYPAGKITGKRYYTASYKLGELTIPIDATDANPIVLSATLQPDGEITFSNYVS